MVRNARHHLAYNEDKSMPLTPKHLTKQEFGRRIYRLMLAKGWNQSELARQAGLPRDSVSVYVRGRSIPTAQSLAKLAAALDVEPDQLLPNMMESAIDEDDPALEMRSSPADPSKVWLRVNQLVPLETAVQVIALIQQANAAHPPKSDGHDGNKEAK